MFRVGQKVVCVDAHTCEFAREGEVYTIARVIPGFIPGRLASEYGVYLVEDHDGISPYWARRFLPVVERKTDISIFTAMLNPAKKKRRADRPVTVS